MTQSIISDNMLYLEAWMNYNPSLRENLVVEGNDLIYRKGDQEDKVHIHRFYLPEMLYNENFKNAIQNHEFTSYDLFQIIKLYVETQDILENRFGEEEKETFSPKIVQLEVRKDEKNQEFLVLIDENNQKYKYVTNETEKIINLFNDLHEKNGSVTLKELGSVIQNGNL